MVVTRVTAIIFASAVAAAVAVPGNFAAVFDSVADFDLLREECRECSADRVLLRLDLCESCRKYAKLYRNYDFLFACYAERNDEIAADFTVCTDAEVSAHIVCGEPCFACDVAEFSEARKKCGVVN